jgi:hypothetical protein
MAVDRVRLAAVAQQHPGPAAGRSSTAIRSVPASSRASGACRPVPLKVEPAALVPGLRDWFDSLGHYSVQAAAFDTRVHGPAALTGRASKGVARSLRAHGFDLVAEPESFLVTKQDLLDPHETTRARDWGTRLAAGIAPG